eukprot:3737107-Amphidinium_carterae.1
MSDGDSMMTLGLEFASHEALKTRNSSLQLIAANLTSKSSTELHCSCCTCSCSCPWEPGLAICLWLPLVTGASPIQIYLSR